MSKEQAEDWAEEYLNSKEGKEQAEKEFLNYAIFGESTYIVNQDFVKELMEEFHIDASQVLENFKDCLTEDEYKTLRDGII